MSHRIVILVDLASCRVHFRLSHLVLVHRSRLLLPNPLCSQHLSHLRRQLLACQPQDLCLFGLANRLLADASQMAQSLCSSSLWLHRRWATLHLYGQAASMHSRGLSLQTRFRLQVSLLTPILSTALPLQMVRPCKTVDLIPSVRSNPIRCPLLSGYSRRGHGLILEKQPASSRICSKVCDPLAFPYALLNRIIRRPELSELHVSDCTNRNEPCYARSFSIIICPKDSTASVLLIRDGTTRNIIKH